MDSVVLRSFVRVIACSLAFLCLFSVVHAGLFDGKKESSAFVAHDVDDPIFTKVKQTLVVSGMRLSRNYYVKPGQVFHFKVSNAELKPASVGEWYSEEGRNIRISIAKCKNEDGKIVPLEPWRVVWPDPLPKGKKAHRSPVVLQPGNHLPVDVPVNFALPGKVKFDGPEVHLAVMAELNLVSVKATPFVFEIILHRNETVKETVL